MLELLSCMLELLVPSEVPQKRGSPPSPLLQYERRVICVFIAYERGVYVS